MTDFNDAGIVKEESRFFDGYWRPAPAGGGAVQENDRRVVPAVRAGAGYCTSSGCPCQQYRDALAGNNVCVCGHTYGEHD
jgi:hypothetical protein